MNKCCTHNCNEGRNCPARHAYRARVWMRYILPCAALTAAGWVALAVWLWRAV